MMDHTLSWVLLGLVLKTSRRISPVSIKLYRSHSCFYMIDRTYSTVITINIWLKTLFMNIWYVWCGRSMSWMTCMYIIRSWQVKSHRSFQLHELKWSLVQIPPQLNHYYFGILAVLSICSFILECLKPSIAPPPLPHRKTCRGGI